MKATIQIPAGWRRVTRGCTVKGDRLLVMYPVLGEAHWVTQKKGSRLIGSNSFVIRRVAAKGAKSDPLAEALAEKNRCRDAYGRAIDKVALEIKRAEAAKGAKAKDSQDKRLGLVRVGKGTVRPNG